MAATSGTFLSAASIGNREGLSDMIYNTDPTETPFISSIAAKTDALAIKHEWQTDTYRAAASNAAIEGNESTFATPATTARLENHCQIFTDTLVVSRTQDVIRKAGRRSESDYQLGKQVVQIKRDMEYVVTRNQAAVARTTTVAGTMRSLEAWYATNDQRGTNGADGTTTVAATDATTAGLRALTETILKAGIKAGWDAGGNPSILMCGSFNKQVISSFAGNATRTVDAQAKKLVASISAYDSDFGIMTVMPNRFSRDRTVHGLDPSMWALAELDSFKMEPLGKVGDARRWLMTEECTLESRNEKASFCLADLTIV